MKEEFPSPAVGLILFQLRITDSFSLKDRRQVVRSLLEKARNRFNASAADLGPEGSYQEAFLAFSVVSGSSALADEILDSIERLVYTMEDNGEFFVVRKSREVERNAWFPN